MCDFGLLLLPNLQYTHRGEGFIITFLTKKVLGYWAEMHLKLFWVSDALNTVEKGRIASVLGENGEMGYFNII